MSSSLEQGAPPLSSGMEDLPSVGSAAGGRLRVGTWNMSGWRAAKARAVFAEVSVDVLALQETHLAAMPLQWAHGTMREVGGHLHHGHPVRAVGRGAFGRSCGVGFVTLPGVAVLPVLPVGAAWRWLHAVGRLHAVRLAPRAGLPRGLLLVSVYAPLQTRQQGVDRRKFVAAMQEVTHVLDLQEPTLLMGDFNGSVCPGRDFHGESAARREACPLLAHLLGPGGAWVDVHASLINDSLPWTFQSLDQSGKLSASRIDLILANHVAMRLVRGARVLTDIRDGGHSPVLVDILFTGPASICWHRPQPKLPPLLQLSSTELRGSSEWQDLLLRWSASPEFLQTQVANHSANSLSRALAGALQHLVALAGGWVTRPAARRQAYDSSDIRKVRGRLHTLHAVETLARPLATLSMGCWPRPLVLLCDRLLRQKVALPRDSLGALRVAVTREIKAAREKLDELNRQQRRVRHARWRDRLPELWRERPGVVHHWLQAPTAAWGSTPIVDDAGQQCTSVAHVDQVVRQFWVDQVLRQHAMVDGESRWRAFQSSEFYPFIPQLCWSHQQWTGSTVQAALGKMKEGAAPGVPGIPLAVWKALPDPWLDVVARLFNLVEMEGVWPLEWLEAYVVMIPKASGGSRPRDQRPITVLPVVYRLWSKGVTMEWAPTMQQLYLGQAALGFRTQSGTLHIAQLLSDIIALRQRMGEELWLVSFDIAKCYDSIPWWALFGVMRCTGMPEMVVRTFEVFYAELRRHFRYGQVAGEVWKAANSLMQGCPAAPDQLNMLLEPFHRWALTQDLGVEIGGRQVPSVSFADDVALVGRDKSEALVLIDAYLRWCSLLGLNVTKIQVWSNTGREQEVRVGTMVVKTVPLFRMVGVVLGEESPAVTGAHFAPRLESALATLQRLRTLELPSSICSLLWRTAVLPRALYGCEIRDVTPELLVPLSSGGKAAIGPKFPLRVNEWRAPEVLMGPPFGESLVRDPVLEVRERQLQWLLLVSNMPGLVGDVHRAVAWRCRRWQEPNKSLRAALRATGWTMRRNLQCLRTPAWPGVLAEEGYSGVVLLQPVDDFPLAGAVFTDGSVYQAGGAAAVQPDTEDVQTRRVPEPRSSTHCELVALLLALELSPTQILTDSLVALTMLRNWGCWSALRTLQSPDRVEVRRFVHQVHQLAVLPELVKVKAHDDDAIRLGHPRAVGNDLADCWAKRAATESGHEAWTEPVGLYGDPVELLDAAGAAVMEVRGALAKLWWDRRRRSRSRARPILEQLYPVNVPVDWAVSTGIFRRPTVSGATFVHSVPPAVIKWVARVRAGCLASRARLVGHGLEAGPRNCLCCGAAVEDDEHILAGCPATGTQDWLLLVAEVWSAAAKVARVNVSVPRGVLLAPIHIMLMGALIPVSAAETWGLPAAVAPRFLTALHRGLATAIAECLRRREELMAAVRAQDTQDGELLLLEGGPPCPLPVERRLTATDLRSVELRRRQDLGSRPAPSPAAPVVPATGEPRRRWLRQRLVSLIMADMLVCPPMEGVAAVAVLELFERRTGEAFSDTPGMLLGSRVRGMAKVLGNLSREGALDPPLVQVVYRSLAFWNRRPREPVDVVAWRRSVEAAEAHSVPVPRLREQMVAADQGLAAWVRQHRYLVPSAVELGESGMALLVLWEVDHRHPYPGQGGDGLSAALVGFTRRLQERVGKDDELRHWLVWKDMNVPLCAGLAPSHHRRWAVRLVAPGPGEPRGWYDEFVGRWRVYLETLARPRGSRPSSTVTEDEAFRIRPRLVVEPSASTVDMGPGAPPGPSISPSGASPRVADLVGPPAKRRRLPGPRLPPPAASEPSRKRHRPSQSPEEAPPPRRQRTLTTWLQSRQANPLPAEDHGEPSPPHHGRAVEGPPT